MQNKNSTVYLVSCVSRKLAYKSVAKELYVSTWFRKARKFIEGSGYPWYILSAKYGAVPPDKEIDPYNETLNQMDVNSRKNWAARVLGQLAGLIPDGSRIVFLAGARYRDFLVDSLLMRGIDVSIPMAGLRIGQQLNWMDINNSIHSAP